MASPEPHSLAGLTTIAVVASGILLMGAMAVGCSQVREIESVYPTFVDPTEPMSFTGLKAVLK